MSLRRKIIVLGWVTLLVFPIPAYVVLSIWENYNISSFLQLDNIGVLNVGLGLQFGIVYAFSALLFLRARVFDKLPNKVENLVREMNLKWYHCVFLSICAAVGEEFLFRVGVQYYCGVWITSILFIAIHGYLNPFNWRMALYGVFLFPFILLLSFAFYEFGLWFSIAAHFSYDLVLFLSISHEKEV